MKNKVLFLLMVLMPMMVFSQTDSTFKSQRKMRPAYVVSSLGINNSNFTDFATSPLSYSGVPIYVGLGFLKADKKRETELGLAYSFGNYTATVENNSASSAMKTVTGFYSRLYQVPSIGNDRWNFMAGGAFNFTGNFRTNPSLYNNSLGIEIVNTLFGSAKACMDVSRTKQKSKKILFLKYNLKPKKRSLSYRLNIGLVNSNYRNGYVYAGQSSVVNDPQLFEEYTYSMFSGFRMGSTLDYTISLESANKIRFSYEWDAYKTGGDFDQFQMASHVLKFTLLFKSN